MNIKKGFKSHNLSKHFKLLHNKNPNLLKIIAIDKVEKHWRGGNMTREISKNGGYMRWTLCVHKVLMWNLILIVLLLIFNNNILKCKLKLIKNNFS